MAVLRRLEFVRFPTKDAMEAFFLHHFCKGISTDGNCVFSEAIYFL